MLKGNNKKDYFYLISIVYFAILGFYSVVGEQGLFVSLSLWVEKTQLTQDIAELQGDIAVIKTDIRSFQENDRTLYRYAREKLNMQSENEIIFIFPERK